MRKIINSLSEVTTLHNEIPAKYSLELSDGYELSISTGSHYNSAELGTVEIALMKNENYIFGDDSDDSIINSIEPRDAQYIISIMLDARKIMEACPEHFKFTISDVYKTMFLIAKHVADSGEHFK